jgi:hypothetical protein
MSKPVLYPELINYIFGFCSKFMTEKEKSADWHHFSMQKSQNGRAEKFYTHFKNQNLISSDEEVIDLLKEGYWIFKENVAGRIYQAHKEELELNLCPKCFKIARTPLAKQCQFCFHSWHCKAEE